ncbi:nucleotidyltransferase domain-containing protein [Candidatus Nomurabacteria bacterium]|nr:nucleotidyltransferase domain-containing protein [Candidatus Nomurabacteria bacterium]
MEKTPDITKKNGETFVGVSESEIDSLKKTLGCFPAIKKCILYGSRITGGYSENSDLDVYLEITGKTRGQISDMKNRIQQMLSSQIKYPIHVKDRGEIRNNQLLWNIENQGVELQ